MFEKIKEVICNYVEVNPEDITPDSRFVEDLGFNSYDFMCMLGDMEEQFGITIEENEVVNIRTVGEAVKYLEGKNG